MTDQEKASWKNDGYILLRQAINPDEVASILTGINRLEEDYRKDPEVKDNDFFCRYNLIHYGDEFIPFIDHPNIYPYLEKLLGKHFHLVLSGTVVRPPDVNDDGFIHTDGGYDMSQIPMDPQSLRPVQMSALFFLTDILEENSGNFCVLPGTHILPFPEDGIVSKHMLETKRQLKVQAGDVILFPHCLWHGAAANESEKSRKILIHAYSPYWVKPFDYIYAQPSLLRKCSERQQRLLGNITNHPNATVPFKMSAEIGHTIIGNRRAYASYYPE